MKWTKEQVSGPDVEIHQCSIGINSILNRLSWMSSQPHAPQWDVVLVNMATLIRNNDYKERSDREVLDGVQQDMHILAQFFSNYMERQQGMLRDPYMVFYMPKYGIPELLARNVPPSKARAAKLCDTEWKRFKGDVSKSTPYGYPVLMCQTGKYKWPHQELLSVVDKESGANAKNTRRFCLITHNPLDYHLSYGLRNLTLFESFTAELRTPQQFGMKIFESPFIPFNRITHVLFGDKYQLKPFLNVKDRKIATEMAKTNRWTLATENTILQEVSTRLSIPTSAITSLKL